MAGKKQFTLSVINQDGILFYGSCDALFVPSERDVIAIMAYHAPMLMKLGKGSVIVREGRKNTTLTQIKAGVMYVGENEVKVLVN